MKKIYLTLLFRSRAWIEAIRVRMARLGHQAKVASCTLKKLTPGFSALWAMMLLFLLIGGCKMDTRQQPYKIRVYGTLITRGSGEPAVNSPKRFALRREEGRYFVTGFTTLQEYITDENGNFDFEAVIEGPVQRHYLQLLEPIENHHVETGAYRLFDQKTNHVIFQFTPLSTLQVVIDNSNGLQFDHIFYGLRRFGRDVIGPQVHVEHFFIPGLDSVTIYYRETRNLVTKFDEFVVYMGGLGDTTFFKLELPPI